MEGVQHLKLLSHLSGVQEVEKGAFVLGQRRGVPGENRLDGGAGMMDQKAFLRVDARGAAGGRGRGEGGAQPVPADVGGEVLLAGVGEEVGGEGVSVVGAGAAYGDGVGELGEGFAVVEGDEEPAPATGRETGGELGGLEGGVKVVVERGVVEGRERGGEIDGGGAEVRFGETVVVAERDSELVPGGGAADEAAEGLGVEELVGENDAGALDLERVTEPEGAGRGEGVFPRALEDAAGGFGADLYKSMGGRVETVGTQERGAGGGDEPAENRAQAGGGVEVRRALAAHS